jgi:hypothetical protein
MSGHPFAVVGRFGFHEDGFGQLQADAKPGVANLANYISVPAEKFDPLLLAKAHLAQAMAHFGCWGKLLDSHRDPGFDLAQRTEKGAIAPGPVRVQWRRVLHALTLG